MTKRLLITGSRTWTDKEEVWLQLSHAAIFLSDEEIILVSGNCPTGADRIAEEIWAELGHPVELHPADWQGLGKRAGFVRNKEMVDLGADLCLAFIKNNSRGASHTADLAKKAGIITLRYFG